MKSNLKSLLACSCLGVFLIVGCGPSSPGNIAPVLGKVTVDGQPVAGVEVVFSPIASGNNGNPGPYSAATTDAEGKFELKTRYGENGAMVGQHNVTMDYADLEPGAMDALRGDLADAKTSEADEGEIKAQMAALMKKLKGRVVIPKTAQGVYDVPAGGIKNANFDLTND